jgi:hypothetical protein
MRTEHGRQTIHGSTSLPRVRAGGARPRSRTDVLCDGTTLATFEAQGELSLASGEKEPVD